MSKKSRINYESLRNVTSSADEKLGRTRRCGVASADQFFDLPDDENVRQYLQTEVNNKPIKQATEGSVNHAIWETLENRRQDFTLLNAGLTIVHGDAMVNDKDRYVDLVNASIINGSQTRGVLREFFDDGKSDDKDYPAVNFELVYAPDLAAEISIARNFQNRVMPMSTYGKMKLFDELEVAMRKRAPAIKLRKSETDVGDGFIDTEKLIQAVTASVPADVKMPRDDKSKRAARAYAFSQKAVCLKDFSEVFGKDKETGAYQHLEYADARQYFLDVAYDVWSVFEQLQTHEGFLVFREKKAKDHAKRSPVKKVNGSVVDVALGVRFPILSALGRFARKTNGHWSFDIPKDFKMEYLITHAERVFSDGAQDPAKMGKDPAAYSSLQSIIDMFLEMRQPTGK